MAFRAETAIVILTACALPAMGQEFRYQARHDHLRKGGAGALIIGTTGVTFTEAARHRHPHEWRWSWQDIQRLTVSPRRLTVLTYQDNRWRMGADRAYRFDLSEGESLVPAYEMLRGLLDQRLVAVLPDAAAPPLWRMPVKHLLPFGGSHGVLAAGPDAVVYKTQRKGEPRTWRYRDIESVSSSGPFELTLTTHEKTFRFQLKEPLAEARYRDLWRRVNRAGGLAILNSYQENQQP